jgi:DNA-binding MarR family transcriptional regulator
MQATVSPSTAGAEQPAPEASTSATEQPAPEASTTATEQHATSATEQHVTSATPSPLATDLYALLLYVNKGCNADLFAAMGLLELTITHIKLLHQLESATGELTVKQAAELIPLSLPATSRTVDDLVRRGMVRRHEDSEDRRMKRISLSDEGRAVIRRVNASRLVGVQQFTETLNSDERSLLSGALAALLEREDVAACRPEVS